jgi:ankyrin repeat protein
LPGEKEGRFVMGSSRQLPARPSLEHLKKEAKQRLRDMRRTDRGARLTDAQLVIAREYGFSSWRELNATLTRLDRERVFAAARAGDTDSVRQALDAGLHPGVTDDTGQSLHQVAKSLGHTDLELLMRDRQEHDERPAEVKRAVASIHAAAADGRLDDLQALLERHPDLLDARGLEPARQTALHKAAAGGHRRCVQLLLECGASVNIRDYGDNAYPLHFAAFAADLAVVRLLVEAGADVIGDGDDHQVGELGWATCLGRVREDVAVYLLAAGARLSIWSAIALGRADEVRGFVHADPAVLTARMSRSEHRRTPLHHAAAVNRPDMVRLLLDLGAPVDALDATGGTALTLAARQRAEPRVLALLEEAGAAPDLLAAVSLERYDLAEQLLAADPGRLGPDGRDTIALHVLVAQQNVAGVRWLLGQGVDVNAKRVLWDCNSTALHVTAEHGLVDMARLLLDAGADPDIRDDKYEATVLGWAEYCGHPEIVSALRQRSVGL